MIVLYILTRSRLPPQILDDMIAAREKMLGKESEMTVEKPVLKNGIYKGGIAWERSHQAVNLGHAPRSYILSTSVQNPKMMEGPAKSVKVEGTCMDEDEKMRKEVLRVRMFLEPDKRE